MVTSSGWSYFALALLATGVLSGSAGCGQQAGVADEVRGSEAAAGDLVSAGAMATTRAAHTATLLADGRILVAGGLSSGSNTAELYDPASGSFASTQAMLTPHHSHSATRLPDGRVLLAGGYDADGSYLASAEIYDPETGTFSATGVMAGGRAEHVGVPLQDGRVLLVGGVGEGWTFLSSAELYDPATSTFTATGSMNQPRENHAAVRLPDGRVLVVGGHHGRRAGIQLLTSAEIYDPRIETFRPAAAMTTRRHKHDAVLLFDGRVLVTGGADERDNEGVYRSAEIYDPAADVFEAAGEMRLGRYKHRGTSVVLSDGRRLLAGGAQRAEIYDPASGDHTLVPGQARMPGQFSAVARCWTVAC